MPDDVLGLMYVSLVLIQQNVGSREAGELLSLDFRNNLRSHS